MLLAGLCMLQPVHAVPVTATGTLSAAPGGTVLAGVEVATLDAFEFADLRLVYDPAVLVFSGAADPLPAGLLLAGAPADDGALKAVLISYAIGSGPISGIQLQLLSLRFDVRSDASAGLTTVTLDSLDLLSLDLSLQFDITVLSTTPPPPPAAPEPHSAALVLLALGAVAATRRGRRHGTTLPL